MPELSGFEVMVLIKEICSTLRGAYVNNIYTLGDTQLIRFRRPGTYDTWLVASPKLGVWISQKVAERGETSDLTSKLRRELERSRFQDASQIDLDRVFELTFGDDILTRKLIVEMMPPGNLVLTDGEANILQLKEEVRSKARRLVTGGPYSSPVQGRLSPNSVTAGDVTAMALAEKTVGRAIGRHVAMPRKYVAEALSRLELSEDTASAVLLGREGEVTDVIESMLREAKENPRPCTCETGGGGTEMFVFRPHNLKVKSEYASVSAMCDEVLLGDAVESARPISSPEEKARLELEATLSNLQSQEEELRLRASKFRSLAASATHSQTAADAEKLVSEAGLKLKTPPSSTAAVASLLYDSAKELEVKASQARLAAARISKRIMRAKTRESVGSPSKKLALRRMEWYEKFRWFFTSEGRLAIGGRDAQSNALLLRRHIDDNDVVYHADLFGSPFFLLKGGKGQTASEVHEVAQATVAFSSAWKTGLGTADAYWVTPDQVSSAAPSGEYLPRGSFAIRGRKNFVTKNLVEVAVGVDADGRITAGPEISLSKRMTNYLVLRPHKEKASETAKRVLRDLMVATGGKAGPSLDLDSIIRALPAGGGKIVRKTVQKQM